MPLPPRRHRALVLGAVLWLALVAGCGRDKSSPADSAYGPGHAVPRLISETAAVTPGKAFTLGITFDIEPEWHLYWKGASDTGYPIQVTPELPKGFRIGELKWPAPERKVSPGGILDHVYRGRVTLLLPVHPPENLEAWSSETFSCRLRWMACKEACVPGESIVSLTLPVLGDTVGDLETEQRRAAEAAVTPATLLRFREARARWPVPVKGPWDGVRWEWKDRALVLRAEGAARLAFYPYKDSAPLQSALRDGVSETGVLTLTLAEDAGTLRPLSGVLEIDPGDPSRSSFYALIIPVEDTQRR